MSTTSTATRSTAPAEPGFEQHRLRGRFNAAFFRVMGPMIEISTHRRKARVFADLPETVVELGSGVGANLGYLPSGGTLIAVEPNLAMHRMLRAAAARAGIHLELRPRSAASTGLADHSVDTVISSLVLCSVDDPGAVLAEVRRILKPNGTFRFVEHVAARPRTVTRLLQRLMRRPWGWVFEGCSCERDLEGAVTRAGFVGVTVERYRLVSPFLTFNPQIAGVARA